MTIRLDAKYTAGTGQVFLTGPQALVRLPMTQARRDRLTGTIDPKALRISELLTSPQSIFGFGPVKERAFAAAMTRRNTLRAAIHSIGQTTGKGMAISAGCTGTSQ